MKSIIPHIFQVQTQIYGPIVERDTVFKELF